MPLFLRPSAWCPVAILLLAACGGTGDEVRSGRKLVTQLVQPDRPLAVTRGVPVTIEWVSGGSGGTVELLADEDGDPSTTADQLVLATGLPTSADLARFTWHTDDAPLGRFHVLARTRLNDGVTTAVAPGPVELVEPLLEIEDLEAGTELRHPLALVTGAVPPGVDEVRIDTGSDELAWPTVGGRFKALVPLAPGSNMLLIEAGGVAHRLDLSYRPIENPRFVRLVYLLSSDGEGTFDAPDGEPNDVESAKRRIGMAAELMQTFTAETLHREGHGRRTFNLLRDEEGVPVVEIVRSSLTTAEARAMDDLDLWFHFYDELAVLDRRDESIDVAIMSMTHYDAARGAVFAHTALGGGRLALFGSGALHTWAESVDEVLARFLDGRYVEDSLFDDSAGRGTYWANFSTGVGATLHELGHCFWLPHPADRMGIMAREFDHFNRTFALVEPPSRTSPGLDRIERRHEIGWDPSSVARLRFHRWLEPDDVSWDVNEPPQFTLNGDELTISSAAGIGHVGFYVNGDVAGHEGFFDERPATFTVSWQALQERFPGAAEVLVNAIDGDGNAGEVGMGRR